jgi:integrase
MWTGCRIEELCSLKCSEVSGESFVVAEAKSAAGNRTVPIHSRLKPLLTYLSSTSSDGYVLSGLSFNKFGNRSNAIGKRFGRLKSALGFGPQYVFHSIRKTVATKLENALVPESVSADILGHDKPTMTYGIYSGGTSLAVRIKAIEKLTYPISEMPAFLRH